MNGNEIPPAKLGEYDVTSEDNYYDPGYWGEPSKIEETLDKMEAQGAEVSHIRRAIGGQHDGKQSTVGTGERTQANNYGYFDKPGWVGALSMLPGMPGMAAKAVNAGINANNAGAVAKARETAGLPARGFLGTAKDVLKDNKGNVGRVKYDEKPYSIGLEAFDNVGNTTITPMEAHNRQSLSTNKTVTELEMPKEKSTFSKVLDTASGFLSGKPKVEAPTTTAPTAEVTPAVGPDERGPVAKALDNFFGRTADFNPTPTAKPGNLDTPIEKMTGIEEGWAGRALSKAFGLGETPSAPTPEARPSSVTPVERNTVTPESVQAVAPRNDFAAISPGTPGGFIDGTTGRTSYSPASFSYSLGGMRPHEVAPQQERNVQEIVGRSVPGGKGIIVSGDVNPEDPGWTAPGPKGQKNFYSRSHRHTDEMGTDVFVEDEFGNPVDFTKNPEIAGDMAYNAAAIDPTVGVGWGPGYMGKSTMHIDYSGQNGMWSSGWTREQRQMMDWARRVGQNPSPLHTTAIPTARPTAPQAIQEQMVEQQEMRDVFKGTPMAQAVGIDGMISVPANRYDIAKPSLAAKNLAMDNFRAELSEAKEDDPFSSDNESKDDKDKSEKSEKSGKSEKGERGERSERSERSSSSPGGRVDRGEKGWSSGGSGKSGGFMDGGVKTDKSSAPGSKVDRNEKGWGGNNNSGGVKNDSHSAPGSSVDKDEKGW